MVGTMWAMADTDGRDLAEHFYKSMFFLCEDESVPYYERSAKALRDAVQTLRREESESGALGKFCTLWGVVIRCQ
jgi:hypothetical protein